MYRGPVKASACGLTDIGRRRKNNEDAFVIRDLGRAKTVGPEGAVGRRVGPKGLLVAVCDGMGGHNAGEVASSLALETLEEEMQRLAVACPRPELFQKAVEEVNRRVWTAASAHPKLAGMGTTLTAALICPERAIIAHVGDSRAYFVRKGLVAQLTKDQSVAATLVETGQMTEVEVAETPFRHVLLQAIGTREKVAVALDGIALAPGDTLLLCSDGLSGKLDVPDLARILAGDDLKACAASLVALANERGGEDNITVVLVRLD